MNSFHLLISLAWRNLWRNHRRTLVILFAMVLGVWAMIFTAAFMRGMSLQIVDDTIENMTGHIQIHAPSYLDDPVIEHSFSSANPLLSRSLQSTEITAAAYRIRVPAVVASERESIGLVMVGIDPDDEGQLSFIQSSIIEGHYLKDASEPGVIIGRKLAERLETRLGKRIVLMTQNNKNEIADRGFRIVGIFDTDLEAVEIGYVFLTRNLAAKLVGVTDDVSEIAIKVSDLKRLDEVVEGLRQQHPELDIKAWYELQPISKLMVDLYDSFHLVWHLIVFLAMGFGIVNTLLMAVFERTREFGLFQALGLKPGFILGQVWVEALMLLILGLALGNGLAWVSVLATGEGIDVSAFAEGMEMANLSNIIPFVIVGQDLLLANSVVFVLGMLTGLYPAWRAAHLVPADAITRI